MHIENLKVGKIYWDASHEWEVKYIYATNDGYVRVSRPQGTEYTVIPEVLFLTDNKVHLLDSLKTGRVYWDGKHNEKVKFHYIGSTGLAIVSKPGEPGIQDGWRINPFVLVPLRQDGIKPKKKSQPKHRSVKESGAPYILDGYCFRNYNNGTITVYYKLGDKFIKMSGLVKNARKYPSLIKKEVHDDIIKIMKDLGWKKGTSKKKQKASRWLEGEGRESFEKEKGQYAIPNWKNN